LKNDTELVGIATTLDKPNDIDLTEIGPWIDGKEIGIIVNRDRRNREHALIHIAKQSVRE